MNIYMYSKNNVINNIISNVINNEVRKMYIINIF